MFIIYSGFQHRLPRETKAVVINGNIIVYVLAYHHYTCNDTARHRLQTGPVLHLGMCRSGVFHYGWFLKSFSSLEFLVRVCRQRHTATEKPTEILQRRSAWSYSVSVTFTSGLVYFRNIYPAEYCLQCIS